MFSGRVTRPKEASGAVCLLRPKHLTQRQSAGDRVRIGIVLKQDQRRIPLLQNAPVSLPDAASSWPAGCASAGSIPEVLEGNEVREGFVLFGDFVGVRGQDKSGYPAALLSDCFEDSRQPFGIVGLRQKEIDRVFRQSLRQTTVCRALNYLSRVTGSDEIVLQKAGDEVLFDVKDRLHNQIKMHLRRRRCSLQVTIQRFRF